MSTLEERLVALLTSCELPRMHVDLALYRRLRAMQERLIEEDSSLADEPGRGFAHVIYAALCAGVRSDEAEHGTPHDENTGKRLPRSSEQVQ